MPEQPPTPGLLRRLRHVAAAPLLILSVLLLCAGPRQVRGLELDRSAPRPAPATCRRQAFRVVIDVGHTREVPGAISARGIPEYAFNLQLAGDVRQALLDAGFGKTILLVTSTAPWRGLLERAARANAMAAGLFISIHHDSVPAELLETWEYGGQQNHFSDRFKGYAIFISHDNADRAGSLQFGKLLGRELQVRGLPYTPHYTLPLMGNRRRDLVDAATGVYRYDQLVVLRETRMPAVLLEAGSIVNRQEELELASRERRALTSAAVVAAVEDFCSARSRPHRTAPLRRAGSAAFAR